MSSASPQRRVRSPWLLAAGLPLVFVAGCPQLASDDFSKTAFDSGGSDGGGAKATSGGGGTTPILALTSAASSGGSEATQGTSPSGTDTGSGGGEADTDTSTENTSSEAVTSDVTTNDASTSDATTGGATTGIDPCVEQIEICDGFDNDCDDDIDEDVCGWDAGCAGFAIGDRGYMFCARPLGADAAQTRCGEQGMSLVQIDSKTENDALVREADARWNSGGDSGGNTGSGSWGGTRSGGPGDQQQQPAFWTGGSDETTEGDWRWRGSGTAFWKGDAEGMRVGDAYSNWGDGRPNEANAALENCAAVYFRAGEDGKIGTWNDLECGDGYPFICESP